MRVSSLSDPRIIDTLNRYYVPLWLSRDNYQATPRTPAEDRELNRIDNQTKQKKLVGGSVCVFLLAPGGEVLGTMRVHDATDPEKLLPLLKEVVEKAKPESRDPDKLPKPVPVRTAPKARGKDAVVLHVMARFEGKRANYGLGEDWAELSPDEWKTFLPATKEKEKEKEKEEPKKGDSWQVSEKTLDKLAVFFYPPGPNWREKDSTVKKRSLTAKLVEATEKEYVVKLTGEVEVSHPFGKEADGLATAKLVGYVRYDREKKSITSLRIASTEAQYVWKWQATMQHDPMTLAIELEPPPDEDAP